MRYLILSLAIGMSGCVSALVVPESLLTDANVCRNNVEAGIRARANTPQVAHTYKDDTTKLLANLVDSLIKKENPYAICDDVVVQYIAAQGRISMQNAANAGRAIGAASVVGGIWATGNAIQGIVGAGVGSTTVNATGSRVSFVGGSAGSNNGGGVPGATGQGGSSHNSTHVSSSGDGDVNSIGHATNSGENGFAVTSPKAPVAHSITAAPTNNNPSIDSIGGSATDSEGLTIDPAPVINPTPVVVPVVP